MVIQVTVGDARPDVGSQQVRGTVTARLASRQPTNERRPMIEVSTASDSRQCSVRLTISEAEVLYNALDSLILDAALGQGAKKDPTVGDHDVMEP